MHIVVEATTIRSNDKYIDNDYVLIIELIELIELMVTQYCCGFILVVEIYLILK